MAESSKNINEMDLYAILDLQIGATESEIKEAYRKKALKCHPDKHPYDPNAAKAFQELSLALEILGDKSARAAYDKVLRAKASAKLRHQELDSKRQKVKEDLEREREAVSGSNVVLTDEQKLAAEIDRLRKEGSKLLIEEQNKMKDEINRTMEQNNGSVWISSLNRIKINWKTDNNDESNGGYDESNLRRFLNKYGDIIALRLSHRKKGKALVEFASKEASERAIELEKGLPENPLQLKWVNGRPILSTPIADRAYESMFLSKIGIAIVRQKLTEEILKEEHEMGIPI